jgi:hypothetical protein
MRWPMSVDRPTGTHSLQPLRAAAGVDLDQELVAHLRGTHQGVDGRRGPYSARTRGPMTLAPSAGVFQD